MNQPNQQQQQPAEISQGFVGGQVSDQQLGKGITPTVDMAIDDIWKCDTEDFRSAARAMQTLRLAIVAEWELEALQIQQPKSFSYDPSETFLSLQAAALRFHSQFETIKSERNGQSNIAGGDDSLTVNTTRTAGTNMTSLTGGVEWELTEQAAWEVWEESVRASAALTHACVGPSWRRQVQMRRQLMQEQELRQLYQPQLPHQGVSFGDGASVSSSVAESMTSSFLSMDMSSAQRTVWQRPTDVLDMISVTIPEVLPGAMLRFAANVAVPRGRSASSKVYWNPSKSGDGSRSLGGHGSLLHTLSQYLHEERRWLRRRKRLGDTQRDLAFGIFCGGDGLDEGRKNESGVESHQSWSVPGAHMPVATMIQSWLDTCQAPWPSSKELEEGKIPFLYELVNGDDDDEESFNQDKATNAPPPTEIVVPSGGGGSSIKEPEKGLRYTRWGDLVDLTRIDFWYTLRVLRDCSDLVSAGWCPPPTIVGESIVMSLLNIAERGLVYLLEDSSDKQGMDEEQVRKERLVACSCSSESLVALKVLAARDDLPEQVITAVSISLCRLLSATETKSPSSVSENGEEALFDKEIQTQRGYIASTSAELLWVLLSSDATACQAADALLDVIDLDFHSIFANLERRQVEECVKIASGAIRALSASFWGDPPQVLGVPLLRFLWEPVMDILSNVAMSYFPSRTTLTFDLGGHETAALPLDCQFESEEGFAAIVLEIALAYHRLIDSELIFGTMELCATEIEALVRAMNALSPWIVYRGNSAIAQDLHSEVISLFNKITSFMMSKCSQNEAGFHIIVDDDARRYLHTFMLRKAVPLFVMKGSLAKPSQSPSIHDDAPIISLAVIKSWTVVGYLPYKDGSWKQKAEELLAEAFFIPTTDSTRTRFVGGYLHHPSARLEALSSLVEDDAGSETSKESDSVSNVSTITSVSMRSGNCPPTILSLFTLTMNLRELHLLLVNDILLPCLEEILSLEEPRQRSNLECQPLSLATSNVALSEAAFLDDLEKDFYLRRYALKILGMLFRSRTGEEGTRSRIIDHLKLVATSTPAVLKDWVAGHEDAVTIASARSSITSTSSASSTILMSDFLKGESVNLRLEAIHQLELCLAAPFTSLPHSHRHMPQLLQALCDTASFYSFHYDEDDACRLVEVDREVLTIASILPFARLSCSRDGHAMFQPGQYVSIAIPRDVMSVVMAEDLTMPQATIHVNSSLNETLPIVTEERDSISEHGDVAPFVFVNQSPFKRQSRDKKRSSSIQKHKSRSKYEKQGTSVDFHLVVALMKSILEKFSQQQRDQKCYTASAFNKTLSHGSMSNLRSIICSVCINSMSTLLSHGMMFPVPDDLSWLSMVEKSCHSNLLELSQLCVDYVGILGHILEDGAIDLARQMCVILTQLGTSSHREQKIVARSSSGLISILSALRLSFGKTWSRNKSIDSFLSATISTFIGDVCIMLNKSETSNDVLIPLLDATREAISCADSFFEFSMSLRRCVLLSLYHSIREEWEFGVVVHQCAVVLISTLTSEQAGLMDFCLIEPDRRFTSLPNSKRIQPLIKDLLKRKLTVSNVSPTQVERNQISSSARVHTKLARDALAYELFPVNVDNDGNPQHAYWNIGDSILSIRLAAMDSNARGWVEVIIRSSSSRIRRLVKWRQDSAVSDYPEVFLPFWEQLHTKDTRTKFGGDSSRDAQEKVTGPVEDESTSRVISKAMETVARFDDLLVSGDLGEYLKSDGAEAEGPTLSGTVFSWLTNATGKKAVDTSFILELEKLGISRFTQGVPSLLLEKLPSPTCRDLFVHKYIKPFSVNPKFNRALSILDRLSPFQTHRVAIFYGGKCGRKRPSKTDPSDSDHLLMSTQASPDFCQFCKDLGALVPLRHCKYFSGGLDTENLSDGQFALVWFDGNFSKEYGWNDPISVDAMVLFHSVILMPDKMNSRKRHVGNDIVHIVFDVEGDSLFVDHERTEISGQFGLVTIYVVLLVHAPLYKVSVHLKGGIDDHIVSALDHLVGSWLISAKLGANFVRNLAMQADVICQSIIEDKLGKALNAEERFVRIKDTARRHLLS